MFRKILAFSICFFMCSITAYGKDIKALYIVKNSNPESVIKEIGENFNDALFDKENNVLYTKNNPYYYFRAYKSNNNTELFICSNEKNISSITEKLSSKTYIYNDKATFDKYSTDFSDFVSNNNINSKSKKKSGKNEYKNYNPYMGKIRNKVLETRSIENNNILIERKKLKAKCKVKHYTYEYVYNIRNNTGKDIIIKKVASPEFIGLTQIAAYTLSPRGMDFVPIYGLVYGVQTDLEKNKFTRPHPIDETIKAGASMRILAMAKLQDNPIADFVFIIDDKEITIKF